LPAAAAPALQSATGRPVYAPPGEEPASDASSSPYRIHVVHNGDTLERLAERYLSDGARALELFDLNRDVLENPHLLPIGAELRVPPAAADATKGEREE
jgi:nucleoid-associated protein YgaU